MLGFTHVTLIAGLLAASLHSSRAFAADCGSASIGSVVDADLLRQNCPVVTGDIDIGPFTDDIPIQHINLDGIEVIEGYLRDRFASSRLQNYTGYTLSIPSLKTIGGVSLGKSSTDLLTVSLPNLTTVNGDFALGEYGTALTYLDITKLESVRSMTFETPNLTTLHHNGLRNATYLSLSSMRVKSLDSLLDRPLNLRRVRITGEFPNVDNVFLGFNTTEYVIISANLSVTLGGSSAGEMTIGELDLSGGITDLKRSPHLTSLEVDKLELGKDLSITHLELPFDNLRALGISQYRVTRFMKKIALPSKAVNWTGGFDLRIAGTHELNMTSMYDTDDKGHRIQTWYWPTNVSYIWLDDVNIGNPFFDTFVSQQMSPLESTPPPSVLERFYIHPSSNTTNFTCTPFTKLIDMGRLPDVDVGWPCHNSSDSKNGAISLRLPSLPILVSAVLGAGVWAL